LKWSWEWQGKQDSPKDDPEEECAALCRQWAELQPQIYVYSNTTDKLLGLVGGFKVHSKKLVRVVCVASSPRYRPTQTTLVNCSEYISRQQGLQWYAARPVTWTIQSSPKYTTTGSDRGAEMVANPTGATVFHRPVFVFVFVFIYKFQKSSSRYRTRHKLKIKT
jgi:hypothetical protein